MAAKPTETITLELRFAKETKGTYVYTMVKDEAELGNVYLNKLLFKGKPGESLMMNIVEKK